jgi:hypothetical protein
MGANLPFSPGCKNASLYWLGKKDRTALWTKEDFPHPRLPITAISMSFDACDSIPKSSLRNAGRLAMVKGGGEWGWIEGSRGIKR